MPGTVAITMAGLGSRFAKAGYKRPKYEIEVLERPLFDWSMMALEAFREAGWRFVFAARAEESAQSFLEARCRHLGILFGGLVELAAMTDGQATTALYLAEDEPIERPFLVFNIDTFVRPGRMRPDVISKQVHGWIPCFPGPGDGWSFVRVDAEGRASEVREKERISDHATVGLYWFSSAGLFRDTYNEYFHGGQGAEKGERYIAPMYNHLISVGLPVTISQLELEDVGMLGTPEQVAAFAQSPPQAALNLRTP